MKQKKEHNEPEFEVENCGCECTKEGNESEWEWTPDEGVYKCSGCGEVQ